MLATIALPLLLTLSHPALDSPHWGDFRGPSGSGIAESKPLPEELSPEKTLRWRTEVPVGYSSPTVAGDCLFLTACEGEFLYTLCFDRHTGEERWRQEVPYDGKRVGANHVAAPTPVTDGKSVFVLFHSVGLLAYDLEGESLWEQTIGPVNIPHGLSTSPLLHDDVLILQLDQDSGSYLAAFEKETGEVRWKVDRSDFTHSYSTPALYVPEEGPAQVIVSGSFRICSYSALDGELLWWVGGSAFMTKAVPIVFEDICFVSAYAASSAEAGLPKISQSFEDALAERDADGDGKISQEEYPHDMLKMAWFVFDLDDDGLFDEADWEYLRASSRPTGGLFAIELGGKGDVTESHVLWKYDGRRGIPDVTSPVMLGDTLFMIKHGGILSTFEPSSGELLKMERIGESAGYFASPVAADGKLITAGVSGQLTVISADRDWEVLSTTDLGEELWSTPAIVDGQVYVRTQKALYCFEILPEGQSPWKPEPEEEGAGGQGGK